MGALLLIIVVIVAVASLAAFVAEAQKTAQARQSYLTSVADENLQIVNAEFLDNQSLLVPPSHCVVNLPAQPNCFRSNPLHWGNVTLTIRNSNTASSNLYEIKVSNSTFNYWEPNWNLVSGGVLGQHFVAAHGAFTPFPAKATLSIFLNLTNGAPDTLGFLRSSSITITLLTQVGNFFTTVFNPPTALEQVGLTTVSYQYFNRDVVSLDGSSSQAFNQSKIVSYIWRIEVPTTTNLAGGCTVAALGTSGDYVVVEPKPNGIDTRFYQEATPALLGGAYCLTGPFQVSLSVIDSLGFIGNSSSIVTSSDPNMAPVATLTAIPSLTPASCAAEPTITLTVENIFGTPAAGVVVLASTTGEMSAEPSYLMGPGGTVTLTWAAAPGTANYSCSGPGTITFTINSLPPATVAFAA